MALTVQTALTAANQLLQDDVRGAAGAGNNRGDAELSRKEQDNFVTLPSTYLGAEAVRADFGNQGKSRRAPAQLVVKQAELQLAESAAAYAAPGDALDADLLEEMFYDGEPLAEVLALAVAGRPDDPMSHQELAELVNDANQSADINMGGGSRIELGLNTGGYSLRVLALRLLRELTPDSKLSKISTTVAGAPTPTITRAAGLAVAHDGLGLSKNADNHPYALSQGTAIEAIVARMGPGVRHASARGRVVHRQQPDDGAFAATVHVFEAPTGEHLTVFAQGGRFSEPWSA